MRRNILQSIRQVALDNCAEGLNILKKRNYQSSKSVHQLRVITKRLRAYWQIIRVLADNKDSYHQHNTQLKELAKSLSSSRENAVNQKLVRNFKASVDKTELIHGLDTLLNQLTEAPETTIAVNRDNLTKAISDELEFWQQLDVKKSKLMDNQELGLEITFVKAKKYGADAIKQNLEPVVTHKWRKWVKYWLYQIESLPGKSSSNKSKTYMQTLERLCDALGKYHDLHVLQIIIDEYVDRNLIEIDKNEIKKLIDKEKNKVAKNIIKRYEHTFCEQCLLL